MTDFTPPSPPPVPDIVEQILGAVARHGLTTVAGFLASNGLLTKDQTGEFIQLGLALTLGLSGLAWSWLQKGHAHLALLQAIHCEPPGKITNGQ